MIKKTALVMGAGSTIGNQIVHQLLVEGFYEVVGTYFNTVPDEIGRIATMHCDIRDPMRVDKIFSHFDRLDVLVLASFPFMEADPFDWDAFEESQRFYTGHMRAMWNASKKMTNGGRIVNILGQCVRHGLPSAPHYSAAFAGMHNFANSVNGKYGKARLISVVDVLLAAVDTREWNGVSLAVKEAYAAKMSRLISPQEVARRVAFELSCPVMATELVVDGYLLV